MSVVYEIRARLRKPMPARLGMTLASGSFATARMHPKQTKPGSTYGI